MTSRNTSKDFGNVNLKKLWKQGYKFSTITTIINGTAIPICLLCEVNLAASDHFTAFYVDPENKRVTEYFICETCGLEVFRLPDAERRNFLTKVIEHKINTFLKAPQMKMSQVNSDLLTNMKFEPITKKEWKKIRNETKTKSSRN